ncbi:MAG: hypothetical protein [Circular genetic element sp.]|nr:MAG: hypothetical protein [Circular genetic element sp.]
MARSSGRKQSGKKGLELTQRFMYYNLSNTATSPGTSSGRYDDSHYIDLAAGLSAMNRRLYRQGRQYHIANITVVDTSGDSKVRFATLPQVWTTNKAHKLMFDAWKDQRSRALENAPSNVTGRWADFKVYMSGQHRKENIIFPVNSDLGVIPNGEWEYSEIEYIDAGSGAEIVNQPLWMLGTHEPNGTTDNGVGLCKALEEMLAIPPESPIVPDLSKSVIMQMNPSTGDNATEVLANIRDDNDLAPYNGATVIGSMSTATATNSFVTREVGWSEQGIASLPVMGFPVPLGLLEVRQSDKDEGNEIGVLIEFVPGSYKGVHAEAF